MNFERRETKKYSFRNPDLSGLRKLGSTVSSHKDFRVRYERLLGILKAKVEDGIIYTLVQFYDPLYHCFTFPDSQLAPTLEEYSYLVGLSVSDKVPFSGLEEIPKPPIIAEALHLETSVVKSNLTSKGGILGLTSRFLMEKALALAKENNGGDFEVIFALLIYGLMLFPNINNFIDVNAIQIFLIGNPSPTLLGDTYHYIHHRTSKGGETITCCAPMLYKWFNTHLP